MSNTRSEESASVDRSWPDQLATEELRLDWEWLRFLRITAVNKAAGLSTAQATATPLATSPVLSILGIIKHLTAVERWWISITGGGRGLPSLWVEDPTADFLVSEQDTPASVVAAYQAEWQLSEEALAGMAASDQARKDVDGEARTIRWVLTHVIQETARHVGHLDVLRELADGTVGE
jgi:uncharacterized damage-inducible protein DinB